MEPYVFISYARKQFYVAEDLAASLRKLGQPAWLDVQEIAPGIDWHAAIMRGISGCQAVVVVASRASYRSPAVREEVAAARDAGKPIYIAIVDDSPFVAELKDSATIIDCRSDFHKRIKVLAEAIRTGEQHDDILTKRRFIFPRLPFGFTKYFQLLVVILFFVLGTIYLALFKSVTVGRITPQALPLVILIAAPVALWFLSFGYSIYLLLAFRFQRGIGYTVLDAWPVFCLYVPLAVMVYILEFDTSTIGLSLDLGFSVSNRVFLDLLPLSVVVSVFILLLIVYLAMTFASLRTIVLVFVFGPPLALVVGLPIPPIIRYPLLLLLSGAVAYLSLRGTLTGTGVADQLDGTGWATVYGSYNSRVSNESRNWGRWLTPGSLEHDAAMSHKLRLREEPSPATNTVEEVRTWHLHYQPSDIGCVTEIRRILSSQSSLQEAPPEQARYHIVVLSSRTPRTWLNSLASAYGPIICVAVSAIDISAMATPLHQNQWVDFRQQRPEQLSYLAHALAGDDVYVNPTTPQNLLRPVAPYPVSLVSHALRVCGLANIALGVTAFLIMHDSNLALFSIPQAAVSFLIGALAFWEAQRLRVRNTSMPALIATVVLTWLNLAYWLISGSLFVLEPRAMLTHNGTYNQFLTYGFATVALFIGVPIGLVFVFGWLEFVRGQGMLSRWLPGFTLPTWRRTLMPPLRKRLDIMNGVYALATLLITALLVVNSPYQYPKVHEYDVVVSGMVISGLVYADGKVWFGMAGDNTGGYGLGYILPDGTVNPVQFLTPQPPDCQFSIYGTAANEVLTDCYEGDGLQLGPDHDFWYETHMVYSPNKMQIVRVTPTGKTATFPLDTQSSLDAEVHFTFDAAGNLWFTRATALSTVNSTGNIGRIDRTGHVMVFPTMANSDPGSIVAGPDGNLWFRDANRGQIGKFTPSGTVTFYTAAFTVDPGDLTVGGDHDIWYAGLDDGTIGRMAADGTAVSFLQPPGSKPEDLVWGPDGALWFLDTGRNAIGRVAHDGTTRRYPLPGPVTAYSALVVGTDGNLWCGLGHQIDRITPSGVITSYAIPTLDADVTSIVSTPDHHIWFVESTVGAGAGLIGEIV